MAEKGDVYNIFEAASRLMEEGMQMCADADGQLEEIQMEIEGMGLQPNEGIPPIKEKTSELASKLNSLKEEFGDLMSATNAL